MLGEINTKLSAVNAELNARMASGEGGEGGGGGGRGALSASRQPTAQYCGPYKLEKTLGKGQTGDASGLFWPNGRGMGLFSTTYGRVFLGQLGKFT